MATKTMTHLPDSSSQTPRFGKYVLLVVVASLIGIAIASRFVLMEWPNFKPVFAIAIFIGFLCRSHRWALVSVAVVMVVSDSLIGFYEWPLMLTVYGSLFVACWLGMRLRNRLFCTESVVGKTFSIAVASVTGSVFFFLSTNVAVWMVGWYPANAEGFVQALVAGIPFFKFTVFGDLCFTLLLFAAYYSAMASLGKPALYQTLTIEKQQV